jgi:hypothetical protein
VFAFEIRRIRKNDTFERSFFDQKKCMLSRQTDYSVSKFSQMSNFTAKAYLDSR